MAGPGETDTPPFDWPQDEALQIGDQVGFGDPVEQFLIALLGHECRLLALGQLLVHGVQLFEGGGQLFHGLAEGGRRRCHSTPALRETADLMAEEVNLGGVIVGGGKGVAAGGS